MRKRFSHEIIVNRPVGDAFPLFTPKGEEAWVPGNVEAMHKVREFVPVPLATGERDRTIWEVREILEAQVIDILQPDCGHGGGITQMVKVATLAEAHHVPIAPHCTMSYLGLTASLHVAASVPFFLIHEGYKNQLPEGIAHKSWEMDDEGYVSLPEGPGLGVEVDESVIDEILDGLEEVDPLVITEAEKRLMQALSLDEVLAKWDVIRSDDAEVKHFYCAAPGGKRTVRAYSQDARWDAMDLDRQNGCIRDIDHPYSEEGGLAVLFGVLSWGFGVQNAWLPVTFLCGGFFSALAGFFGMRTATLASTRTAAAARQSLDQGLRVAFRSGANVVVHLDVGSSRQVVPRDEPQAGKVEGHVVMPEPTSVPCRIVRSSLDHSATGRDRH